MTIRYFLFQYVMTFVQDGSFARSITHLGLNRATTISLHFDIVALVEHSLVILTLLILDHIFWVSHISFHLLLHFALTFLDLKLLVVYFVRKARWLA